MSILRVIFEDQLSPPISCLENCDKSHNTLEMCEVFEKESNIKRHMKKIAFLISAIRHFCAGLKSYGYSVTYLKLDDMNNAGLYRGNVKDLLSYNDVEKLVVSHPSEYKLLKDIENERES